MGKPVEEMSFWVMIGKNAANEGITEDEKAAEDEKEIDEGISGRIVQLRKRHLARVMTERSAANEEMIEDGKVAEDEQEIDEGMQPEPGRMVQLQKKYLARTPHTRYMLVEHPTPGYSRRHQESLF